jgi:hypothetical protein
MLTQVGNDDGKEVVFASMPAEADRQRDQLRGVLQGLGATSATPSIILSDGVNRPRSLGEAATIDPTHHVLDWFHLAMRIQHAAQAAQSWPDFGRPAASIWFKTATPMPSLRQVNHRLVHGACSPIRTCSAFQTGRARDRRPKTGAENHDNSLKYYVRHVLRRLFIIQAMLL